MKRVVVTGMGKSGIICQKIVAINAHFLMLSGYTKKTPIPNHSFNTAQ